MRPRQNPPYLQTQGNILRPFSTKGNDELYGTVPAHSATLSSTGQGGDKNEPERAVNAESPRISGEKFREAHFSKEIRGLSSGTWGSGS